MTDPLNNPLIGTGLNEVVSPLTDLAERANARSVIACVIRIALLLGYLTGQAAAGRSR